MVRHLIYRLAALFFALQGIAAVAQVSADPPVYGAGNGPPALPATSTPLPALPLAVGAKVMGLGDSEIGFNHGYGLTGTNGYVFSYVTGPMVLARDDLTNFNFDTWYDAASPWAGAGDPYNGGNQGVPGDHLDWYNTQYGNGCLNRSRYAVNRAPAIVVINCGTNSISSGDSAGAVVPVTAAYVTAKLDALVSQFTSRGTYVILSTIYPRTIWSTGTDTAAAAQKVRDVNTWIRAQAGRAGVRVMDPYAALVSADNADQANAALFKSDGVHLNQAGSFIVARNYLEPILSAMIASGTTFSQDPTVSNLYPTSFALLNGGTTGSKANGVTGTVATGTTVNRNRGTAAVVASIEDAGTYKRQVIAITPVNDSSSTAYHEVDFNGTNVSTTQAAGTWVQPYVHIETADALSASIVRFNVTYVNGSTSLSTPTAENENSPTFTVPTPGRGGYWLIVPPWQVPASGLTAMGWQLNIFWPKTTATPFTVKIDRLILRAVPDPRTAWNLP